MTNLFKNITYQKISKILALLIIINFCLVFSICLFKYFNFLYNGFDLAIFNQVFYNSSLGNLFDLSIHPPTYLGDHFTPIILLLLPIYFIFKSPIILLFLQALFLALAAIPLYLIAKNHLNPTNTLFIIILYLFNPVILNIALFEFHLLTLVPFFIFWTFYFYDKKKFIPFLIFCILSLLIREDIALIIFMFGILAAWERKNLKFILSPILLSSIYFMTALKLVSYFSPYDNYKFLIYYQWLGNNFPEIITNFFLKFHLVFQHIFTFQTMEMILGFFMVFLFIPLLKPKYLLLSSVVFLQISLSGISSGVILQTHYGAIFITVLAIAAIFSLKEISINIKYLNFFKKHQQTIILIIIVSLIYNLIALGPIIPFIKKISSVNDQETQIKKVFFSLVPEKTAVASTYEFMPALSSREKIYSLNYAFLGQQQYGISDYKLPNDTQYLLINFADIITYHLQYGEGKFYNYKQSSQVFRNMIADNNFQLKKANKNLALYSNQGDEQGLTLYEIHASEPQIHNPQSQILNNQLVFLGLNQKKDITSLYFKALTKIESNYFLKINQELYPIGYGFYPTSDWQEDQIIQLNFYSLEKINDLEIIDIKGAIEVDGLGSVMQVFDQINLIGQINLD
jgi:uncharacterized membrane protein